MLQSLIESRVLGTFLPATPFTSAAYYEPGVTQLASFAGREVPKEGGVAHGRDIVALGCWHISPDGVLFIRHDFLHHGPPVQVKVQLPDKGIRTPMHSHADVELACVVKGVLRQNICGKEEVFHTGEICLIDHDSQHYDIVAPQDACVLFLSLSNLFFEDKKHSGTRTDVFLRDLVLERKERYKFIRFVPKEGMKPESHEVLATLLREFWQPRAGTALIIRGLVERLLSLLPVEYRFSLSKDEQAQMRAVLFREVRQYLEENYHSASIPALCARFNYSEDYFNRLIKQFTGETYSKLLQGVRLRHALQQLTETSLPVADIAAQVGYANIGYFYKIFVEKYGDTPSGVRRSYKKTTPDHQSR